MKNQQSVKSVEPAKAFDGTVVRPSRIPAESDNAVILSPDGYPITPSKIPAEFKLVMTQELKDLRKIMTELMFEYDQKHCRK